MATSIDQKKRLSVADLRNQRAAQGRMLGLRLLNDVRTGPPPQVGVGLAGLEVVTNPRGPSRAIHGSDLCSPSAVEGMWA